MVGAFLGAVLISTLELSLVRVPAVSEFWRDAILGLLILGAVILDAMLHRRFTRRLERNIATSQEHDVEGEDASHARVAEGSSADA